MFTDLERKCKLIHQKLKSLNNYIVSGVDISPVKHVRLQFDNSLDKLEKIVDFAQENKLALTVARYLKEEKFSPKPSIRISVNVDLTDSEIDFICTTLEQALKVVGM